MVEITYTLLVMFPSSGGKPLDNHDGMITHVYRARLLDCKEVKWALGSITTNKASGDLSYLWESATESEEGRTSE